MSNRKGSDFEDNYGDLPERASRAKTKSYFESESSSETPASESSDAEISIESDDDFEEELTKGKKGKKNQSKPTKTMSKPRAPRKSFDKQFTLDSIEEFDRPRKAAQRYNDYSSSEESGSFSYSDSSDEDTGVAFRRERRNVKEKSYAEASDSSGSDVEEPAVQKEEYTGPRIERIIGLEQEPSNPPKYYAKFLNQSYIHCQWLKEEELGQIRNGTRRLQFFKSAIRTSELVPSLTIPNLSTLRDEVFCPEFLEVTRVIAYDNTNNKYLVRWHNQTYDEATWEDKVDDDDAIKLYEARQIMPEPTKFIRPKPYQFQPYGTDTNPLPQLKGELRSYQLEGLNWLRFCYYSGRSSILADEMGLGKTIMGVNMISDLKRLGNRGPFLIIAPLSTLMQWEREFAAWSNLNVINFSGSKSARQIIQTYEMWYGERRDICKFEVILTNYEQLLHEYDLLSPIEWEYLIVDEAHRLKNPESKLYQLMEALKVRHILLMTGTPIQNNVEELWALLHFIDPTNFNSLSEFTSKYGSVSTADSVSDLQNLIKPYMLRRKKADVDHTIAAKEETIVKVELTRSQKFLYRMLLDNKVGELMAGAKKLPSMMNLMMQLRKVCNHPFLIQGGEAQIYETADSKSELMVKCSGKMVFVDKLLQKLKPLKSKVLIFSQMVKVLDILEDFMNARGYRFERIDGSVIGNRRQAAMDRFNNPDLDVFAFLLCTRAGGVGLNLTAANTVIIFDSDWNPQNDLQAQARCHRIGQTKEVKVYRLITRGTYESEMFLRASKKLGLDQALLDSKSEEGDMTADEIELLLKKGAYHVFQDDDEIDRFEAEDIDQILEKRTEKLNEKSDKSLFSKATFAADKNEIDLNAPDFWEKVIPGAKERKTNPAELIFTKRCRKEKQKTSSDSEEESSSGIWNKSSRTRLVKALQTFYWGNWGEISNAAKISGKVSDVIDASKVIARMVISDDDRAQKIIGEPMVLTREQKALLKSEVFSEKSFCEYIERNADSIAKRMEDLAVLEKWINSHKSDESFSFKVKSEIPGWIPEYDLPFLRGICEKGWGNWDTIFKDSESFGDSVNPPPSKFLQKRACKLIQSINVKQRDFLPEIRKLIKTGSCESQEMIQKASKALLKDPKKGFSAFKEAASLSASLTEKRARKVTEMCKWFFHFRTFCSTFDEHNECLLHMTRDNRDPVWWKFEIHDAPLIRHIKEKGFTQIEELIAEEPFSKLGLDQKAFGMLMSRKELMAHVDRLMTAYTEWKKPEVVIEVSSEYTKFLELPMLIGEAMVEGLGSGDFFSFEGILCRIGYTAEVRVGEKLLKCSIVDNLSSPFSVTLDGKTKVGESPKDCFEKISLKVDDPNSVFGISLPAVRFWMDKQLGSRTVLRYEKPEFKIIAE